MTDSTPLESVYGLAFETSSMQGSVALGRGPDVLAVQPFAEPRRHAVDFLPAVDAMCQAHGVTPADIGHVFVSAGPGSFTGLRIGITAARMIALAVWARVLGVPTLEVIAQNAADQTEPAGRVVVMLDAQRSRVYAATFVRGEISPGVEPVSNNVGSVSNDVGPVSNRSNTRVTNPFGALYLPEVGEGGQTGWKPVPQAVEADPALYLADCGPDCAVLGEGVALHRSAVEASGVIVLPERLYLARCETVYRLGYARAARGQFSDPRGLVPIYVRPPEAEEKWQERQ